MTNPTMQQAVRQLIANDAYAMTFQSMGQYRTALLKHVDGLFDCAQPEGEAPADELLDMLGRVHPYAMPMEDFKCWEKRLQRAVDHQQPTPVPDQAAIVWRGDLMQLIDELQHKRSVFEDWKKMRALHSAAPGTLLVILRDVHDTLTSESDSDIDHFEDDEEEREGAPVQYAARKVMEVIDLIKAAAASAPGRPGALILPEQSDLDAYANSGYHRFMTFDTFKAFRADCAARDAQLDGGQGEKA